MDSRRLYARRFRTLHSSLKLSNYLLEFALKFMDRVDCAHTGGHIGFNCILGLLPSIWRGWNGCRSRYSDA